MTQTERPTAAEPAGTSCPGRCGGVARVSRRTAISAGVVSGAALLAGCSSDPNPSASATSDGVTATASSSTSTTATTQPPDPTTLSTAPDTEESSAAESSASAPSSEPVTAESSSPAETTSAPAPPVESPPTGTELAKVADVPAGGSLVVVNGPDKVALAKGNDGSVIAHTAVCTHNGCTVNAAGPILHCDCHGSEFDAFTGAVLQSPARSPLAALTVTVFGDTVYLS